MVRRLTLNFALSICVCSRILATGQYIRGGFTINDNQYSLRWDVMGPFITFRAIARGTGYIGFGLSPKGTMEGADLFISGIYDNGTAYWIDAHGAGEKDMTQNYMLLFLRQGYMHTEVHFRRLLHTGDCKDDIQIMNQPQYVIWSIGPMGDALEHHGKENRGAVLVNLLNPPMFHSYYRTNDTMNPMMDPRCVDMTPSSGDSGDKKEGGGGTEPAAPPPAEAPAEIQAGDVEQVQTKNCESHVQSDPIRISATTGNPVESTAN